MSSFGSLRSSFLVAFVFVAFVLVALLQLFGPLLPFGGQILPQAGRLGFHSVEQHRGKY